MSGLRIDPDWEGAAQILIDGCATLPQPAQRLELLDSICQQLGESLYPALVHVLCLIGERGSPRAQQTVAQVFVTALTSGLVPSARLDAWGAPLSQSPNTARRLGPVEYLCSWHAQGEGGHGLPAVAFDRTLRALLHLLSQDAHAKQLYCDKLQADADDPLGGSLTRRTRDGLRNLTRAWREGDAQAAVDAFLQAPSASSLSALAPPWPGNWR